MGVQLITTYKYFELLQSLNYDDKFELTPATKEQIEIFKLKAESKGVKSIVINQLCDLYEVADSYLFGVLIGFHSCTDDTIFEWWEYGELWIGQRDFNTLRWANDKFCLGDAGSISYSSENEYDTLIELISSCIKEIRYMEKLENTKFDEWKKVIEFYKELITLYNWRQEPMLILIDNLKKRGFFSLYYPSTSY